MPFPPITTTRGLAALLSPGAAGSAHAAIVTNSDLSLTGFIGLDGINYVAVRTAANQSEVRSNSNKLPSIGYG